MMESLLHRLFPASAQRRGAPETHAKHASESPRPPTDAAVDAHVGDDADGWVLLAPTESARQDAAKRRSYADVVAGRG